MKDPPYLRAAQQQLHTLVMLRLFNKLYLFKTFLRLAMVLYLFLLHVKCNCENPDVFYKQVHSTIPKKNEQQKEEESNNLADLLQALRNGKEIDVDTEDEEGNSLLHQAAYEGDVKLVQEIIKKLQDKGADLSKGNNVKKTPLHLAVLRGHLEVVKELIANGAKVDVQDEDGRTPLCYSKSAEIAQALIEQGADVNARDQGDLTPLHHATWNNWCPVIQKFINKGANVDAQSKKGLTPLYFAAYRGCLEAIQLLVTSGASVDISDRNDGTALHWAVAGGQLKAIQELLNYNANINAKDTIDQTALHVAYAKKDVEMQGMLFSKGANPDIEDSQGRVPADLKNDQQVIQRVIHSGPHKIGNLDKGS